MLQPAAYACNSNVKWIYFVLLCYYLYYYTTYATIYTTMYYYQENFKKIK